MKLPTDCPDWVEKFLATIEDKAEAMFVSAKTSDEALKASGAYGLWRTIKEEVELEADSQLAMLRRQTEKLHARNN